LYNTLDKLSYTFAREASLEQLTTTMSNKHETFSYDTTTFSILPYEEKQRTDTLFKMAYEKNIQGNKKNQLLEQKIEKIRTYMKQSFTYKDSIMTTIHHVDSGESITVPIKYANLSILMMTACTSECIVKLDVRSSKTENWTLYTLSVVNVLSNRVVASKTYPKQLKSVLNPKIYKHKPMEELIDCVFGGGYAKGMYGLLLSPWHNECFNKSTEYLKWLNDKTLQHLEYEQGIMNVHCSIFPTECNDAYYMECMREMTMDTTELYGPSNEWYKQKRKECEENHLKYKQYELKWKLYETSEKGLEQLYETN
jgi:hypothetical protein